MSDPQEPTSDATLELAPSVTVHRGDLQFTFSRSSGPGGQSVNKVNTAVQIRVAMSAIKGLSEPAERRLRQLAGQRLTRADELLIQAQEHRSQFDNRRRCLERLAALVLEATRVPRPRKKTKPSRAKIQRRLDAKRRLKEKKGRRRWREE